MLVDYKIVTHYVERNKYRLTFSKVLIYSPMTAKIKSPDYAAHAHVGKQLTNHRIDVYIARGVYGKSAQDELLAKIQSGKYKTLDHAIREGRVCHEAQTALNRREVKEVKKVILPTTAEELLKLLDM